MALSNHSLELLQTQLEKERRLVSFDSYDLTVRQLLDMYENGDIFIPPEYQRQFVWDPERQSQLIESVFLGIPIPSLFMATNKDATWEIVDGVQRISTLAHFVAGDELLSKLRMTAPLTIKSLSKLAALNGVQFSELPKSIQLMFFTRPIRITVLNDKSDQSVRFDLFERLNTGGVTLTSQEIRNCVYRGKFNEDIKILSNYPNFINVIKLKPQDKENGTKEELVLRFFAFVERYEQFDHSVKEFLNDYMKEKSNQNVEPALSNLFLRTFDALNSELPDGLIRGNRNITPVNLYEAISVGTALAIRQNGRAREGVALDLLNDEQLRKFTTGATNSRRMVTGRINFVRNALS